MKEYAEEQIAAEFGVSFDQAKEAEGYKDDAEFPQPNRHLTKWYLVKRINGTNNGVSSTSSSSVSSTSSSVPRIKRGMLLPKLAHLRRHALPETNRFAPNDELHGLLEAAAATPSNGDEEEEDVTGGGNHREVVRVVIKDLQTWVVDRSSSQRGIWVGSKLGWYHLREPCDKDNHIHVSVQVAGQQTKHTSSLPAVLPSQGKVHLPLRAKFGLLSNLIDILSEPYGGTHHNYLFLHSKRTVQNSHALLSPDPNIVQRYDRPENPLHKVPFDLELVKSFPAFVKQHLSNYHPLFQDTCVFLQSLDSSSLVDSSSSPSVIWTDEMFRASAEEAEKRGQRSSWGELLVTPETASVMIRPNRLIEIEIAEAAKQAASFQRTNGHDDDDSEDGKGPEHKPSPPSQEQNALVDSDDEDDVPVRPKRKRHLVDSDDDEHEKDGNSDGDEPRTKKMTATAQSMEMDGLDKLGLTLVSKPSGSYSSSVMVQAIRHLTPYLDPKPGKELSGLFSDLVHYTIADSQTAPFIKEVIQVSTLPSLESMLFCVNCLRRGNKAFLKQLFKPSKHDSKAAGGIIVFTTWLSVATHLMELERFIPNEERTEELLACEIIRLICDFHVIQTAKQVDILKKKFNVDWIEITNEMLDFATKYNISALKQCCADTNKHLERLINGVPSDAPAKKDVIVTQSALLPQTSIPVSQAEDIKEIVNAAKEKEAKEHARRQRIANLLKNAKTTAGRAALSNEEDVDPPKTTSSSFGADPSPSGQAVSTHSAHHTAPQSSSWNSASQKKPEPPSWQQQEKRSTSTWNSVGTNSTARNDGWGSSAQSSSWTSSKPDVASSWASSTPVASTWTSETKQGGGWGNNGTAAESTNIRPNLPNNQNVGKEANVRDSPPQLSRQEASGGPRYTSGWGDAPSGRTGDRFEAPREDRRVETNRMPLDRMAESSGRGYAARDRDTPRREPETRRTPDSSGARNYSNMANTTKDVSLPSQSGDMSRVDRTFDQRNNASGDRNSSRPGDRWAGSQRDMNERPMNRDLNGRMPDRSRDFGADSRPRREYGGQEQRAGRGPNYNSNSGTGHGNYSNDPDKDRMGRMPDRHGDTGRSSAGVGDTKDVIREHPNVEQGQDRFRGRGRPTLPSSGTGTTAGRGLGRGRGKTLPAWMTREQDGPSSQGSASGSEDRSGHGASKPYSDKMSLDSGRGIRGDTTIREFEDRGSKYMSTDTQGHSNIQDDSNRSQTRTGGEFSRPQEDSSSFRSQFSSEPRRDTIRGRGRGGRGGRGTHISDSNRGSSFQGQSSFRGRGRGTRSDHRGDEERQKNAFEAGGPPSMGRGRGRGANINLPAWMTQKKD